MNDWPGEITPRHWLVQGRFKQWYTSQNNPDPPYPESFLDGLEHFLAGQYYEAHEVWEDLWRLTPPDTDDRLFYHACIQLAVALHHHGKGNQTGAHNLLVKATDKFGRLAEQPRYQLMRVDFVQAGQQIFNSSN